MVIRESPNSKCPKKSLPEFFVGIPFVFCFEVSHFMIAKNDMTQCLIWKKLIFLMNVCFVPQNRG